MANDVRGLTMSGASDAQAARYAEVMDDYLAYRLSTFPKLKALCEEAPEFVLAHLLKGYLLLSMGSRDTLDAAIKCHDAVAEQLPDATGRERKHAAALMFWARGETRAACRCWDDILFEHPADLLALKLQHFTLFWLGEAQHMRDSTARVLSAYGLDSPGYANVLGMHAFSLEENNLYAQAEELGRAAVELAPEDLWSVHAVAHVLEMQGRLDEGGAWLNKPLDTWDECNPFRGHLWWHAAMFAQERGDYERALHLFDDAIVPSESTFYLDIQNSASLLARLEMVGVDVGDRWEAIADAAAGRQGDHVLLFTEPHCAMVFGATGRFGEAGEQLRSLAEFAATGSPWNRSIIERLAVPLCSAIGHYYHGEYAAAADTLMALRYEWQPLGGSHAQRDVFSLYLIAATIRAGRMDTARALLESRLESRPQSAANWRNYAKVCSALGDNDSAARARNELAALTA